MSDQATEAPTELGWKWPVQQAIWNDLIAPRDNEWTTWSDAIVLTEYVAEVLAREGYVVVKPTTNGAAVMFAPIEQGSIHVPHMGDMLIEKYGDDWHEMTIDDIADAAVEVLRALPVEQRMEAMGMTEVSPHYDGFDEDGMGGHIEAEPCRGGGFWIEGRS